MWNPAIKLAESRRARVAGFRRHFCLTLSMGRGTPDRPGLMLGLDEGEGAPCIGMAHRIAADDVASETEVLWYREMLSGAYRPMLVPAEIDGLGQGRVLVFVIDRSHPRYEGAVDTEAAASRIARSEGILGTNRDYLYRTARQLAELEIGDDDIFPPGGARACACRRTKRKPTRRHRMKTTSYDEIASLAGQVIGSSEWVTIDQDRINKFAEATGDHQWIHVDVERAKKEMPGGKTIAHGYLTLSLIPMLGAQILRIEGVSRGINYGSNKLRFTNMVPVGSKVRATQKLISVEAKAGGLQLTNEMTIEIEGQDRPACVAETISLIYK